MKPLVVFLGLVAVTVFVVPAQADSLSATFSSLANGTNIDLTAAGQLDWVKFGNGDNGQIFDVVTKIGNPVISPIISPVGTADPGTSIVLAAFSGGGNLNFTWTNGTEFMNHDPMSSGPVDTAVTETVDPPQNQYPDGIGATFTAAVANQLRELDVYTFGFDGDMTLSATLGSLSTSTTVSTTFRPPNDPNNDYSLGVYKIFYSGDPSETLTIQTITADNRTTGTQAAFANAGFFAATVNDVASTPEPASIGLLLSGGLAFFGVRSARRGKMTGSRA